MDELPRGAKELLAQALDAHDPPDDGARERVRRGVLLAAGLGGGAAALSGKAVASAASSATGAAVKTGLFASATAKVLLAGSALVVASAVTVVVPRLSPKPKVEAHSAQHTRPAKVQVPARPAAPAAPRQEAPTLAEAPALGVAAGEAADTHTPELSAPQVTRATPRARKLRHAQAKALSAAPSSLEAEMKLLADAADTIAAGGSLARAQALLMTHERDFPHGQLRVEREGLSIVLLCARGRSEGPRRAKAFLRKQPSSVLAARLRAACGLNEEP